MKDNVLETAILKIQVLGHFQVWYQRELLIWPTQKSKALFQILLIEPGRLIPTDQLMEHLWPDLPPSKAKNNLWVVSLLTIIGYESALHSPLNVGNATFGAVSHSGANLNFLVSQKNVTCWGSCYFCNRY